MRAPWEEAKRARLIKGNPTTVRRWLNIENPLDIPQAVAIMLRLLTPAKVKRLIEEAEGNEENREWAKISLIAIDMNISFSTLARAAGFTNRNNACR